MKKISVILTVAFFLSLIFTSCKKDEVKPADQNIVPENFRVEIPEALLSETTSLKSTQDEGLNGNVIYEHLRAFIRVGDEAAEIVSNIIYGISLYNLSQPMTFAFTSNDDDRDKNVVIVANSTFEGKTWEYQMTITDADSEGNEDGGIGMQVFWNKQPVDGIAIIKPYNINRHEIVLFQNAMVRIDYSETGANSYEQEMTVYISGLKLENAVINPFSMETLKMNVGKNGNTIEVYGNSNHPNAQFFTDNVGFNWAFVAAGSNVSKLGVAEVGLPPSELNTTSREVILKDYSIKNVLTTELNQYFLVQGITPSEEDLAVYLQNADAPGYFNYAGFVQGGTSPGSEYDTFENAIESLTPFNPIEVSNLTITFKTE